jgi:phage tail-like protein
MITAPARPATLVAPAPSRRRGRGLLEGLPSAFPMGPALPSLFQEDPFAQRFITAFDDALAPIMASLDNLTAYFDPWLAPEDFLQWLGTWLGLLLDESWPLERRRALLFRAVELYRIRGTVRGLRTQIEIATAGGVEIVDTGGAAFSQKAEASLPGSPNFALMVRVQVDNPERFSSGWLYALVAALKPAHVTHRVELTGRAQPDVPDDDKPDQTLEVSQA